MDRPLYAPLLRLCVFGDLLDLEPVKKLKDLLSALDAGEFFPGLDGWEGLFLALCREGFDSPGAWLDHELRYRPTPFAEAAAWGKETPAVTAAARRDIENLSALAVLDPAVLKSALIACAPDGWAGTAAALPEWPCVPLAPFSDYNAFYRTHGTGLFARYRAFVWDGDRLIPVEEPDYLPEEALWGYRLQRDKVVSNTRALLAGQAVNNILLFGDPGTGKSATVKALLGMEGMEDLRLIEIKKTHLGDLAQLIRMLGHRPQKFILFIDDLSFDKEDSIYSLVKSVLEGGLERRPDNVAVYATSNRRNLVRQNFSDRSGDEVDASETVQEKTSLAERFGLRIPFTSLNRAQFLQMVEDMAARHGVELDRDTLRAEAVKWEMRHPSRTPRTALQFLASLHSL